MCTQKTKIKTTSTCRSQYFLHSALLQLKGDYFPFFFWYIILHFFQLFYFFSAIVITNRFIIFSSGLCGGQSTNWQCLTAFSCDFSISLPFHPIPLLKKCCFWLLPSKKDQRIKLVWVARGCVGGNTSILHITLKITNI